MRTKQPLEQVEKAQKENEAGQLKWLFFVTAYEYYRQSSQNEELGYGFGQ